MAGAVWVSWRFGLPVAATVMALLPTVGGIYLSWATFRNTSVTHYAAGPDLAAAADWLATEVRGQWAAELAARRVTVPYALAVSWCPAEGAALSEPWELIQRTARGWPGGPPGNPEDWAQEPAGLAGRDGEITDVFLRLIPTRRLTVLGEPGSGKTVLLIRLLLGLVEARAEGGPVPVLLPLASWDPATLPFGEWLAQQLARDYPMLGRAEAVPDGRDASARALTEAGLVLPLLDGFDELPPRTRALALDGINEALPPGQAVVLSSRRDAYLDTAGSVGRLPVRLATAAAVELCPLGRQTVADYLVRGTGDLEGTAEARWRPVLEQFDGPARSPVAAALSTPLMLSLATAVYNSRPGEDLTALPDPAELCDRARLPERRDVERHLLGASVPAAYRPHPRRSCRWSTRTAVRTLRFLAAHLCRLDGGSTDLAWWRLRSAVPRRLVAHTTGVLLGLVSWTTALLAAYVRTSLTGDTHLWWVVGAPSALIAGMAAGLACDVSAAMTAGTTSTAASTLAFWIVDPAQAGPRFPSDYVPVGGLAFGFAAGLIGSLVGARTARSCNSSHTAAPWSWDWGMCLRGLAAGLALWFPCAWLGAVTAWSVALVNAAVYATAGGLLGSAASRPDTYLPAPATRLRWSFDPRVIAVGLAAGPAFGMALLLMDYPAAVLAGGQYSLVDGPTSYVLYSALDGLGLGLAAAVRARPADAATASAPGFLLRQDRATFRHLVLLTAPFAGLALAAPNALAVLITGDPFSSFLVPPDGTHILSPLPPAARSGAYCLALAVCGLAVGLAAAISRTACWPYTLTRVYLAVRHNLPFHLTEFLADAHGRRSVLRQAGAVYQFRHLELQHHLTQPADAASRQSPAQRTGEPTAANVAAPETDNGRS
ncbi:NACHT domain-containing protein [Streptomyces fulvoviolaceus]|uniref:NACHT domain-containing protein n=1 Tax=Streptomyces fulvoviolaceus TaxID=285535 RepID=UPI0006935AA1|nr:NACHT domain-containing protein [Streptomyces fulvoviolaceus]